MCNYKPQFTIREYEYFRAHFPRCQCEEYVATKRIKDGKSYVRMQCKRCFKQVNVHHSEIKPYLKVKDSLPMFNEDKCEEYMDKEITIHKFFINKHNVEHPDYQFQMFEEHYHFYLKSDHWKNLRLSILERDNHVCAICGGKATIVHHLNYFNYKVSGFSTEDELTSLCNGCHKSVHSNPSHKLYPVCRKVDSVWLEL